MSIPGSLTALVNSEWATKIFSITACVRLVENIQVLDPIRSTTPYEEAAWLGMAMRYGMIYTLAGHDGMRLNKIVGNAWNTKPKDVVHQFFEMANVDKTHRGGSSQGDPSIGAIKDFQNLYKAMWGFFQCPTLYYARCDHCGVGSPIFNGKAASCVKCGAPLPMDNVMTVQAPFGRSDHPVFDYDTICGRDLAADYPIAVNNHIVTIRTVKKPDWKNIAMAAGWWALDQRRKVERGGACVYYARQKVMLSLKDYFIESVLLQADWKIELGKLECQIAGITETYAARKMDDLLFGYFNEDGFLDDPREF